MTGVSIPYAARAMAEEIFDALMDSGGVFTCTEYTSIVDLYAALGLDKEATTLLGVESNHRQQDDQGDAHPIHTCNDVSPSTVDDCAACQQERDMARAAA